MVCMKPFMRTVCCGGSRSPSTWAPGEFNLSCLPAKWWQRLQMLLPEMVVCITLAQPVVSTISEGCKPSGLYLGQSTFTNSFRPLWIWGRCMCRLPMQWNLELDTWHIHFSECLATVKPHLKSSGQSKPIMVLTKENRFPTTLATFSGPKSAICNREKAELIAGCTDSLLSSLFLLFVVICTCKHLDTNQECLFTSLPLLFRL